jgi:cytochrome c5
LASRSEMVEQNRIAGSPRREKKAAWPERWGSGVSERASSRRRTSSP